MLITTLRAVGYLNIAAGLIAAGCASVRISPVSLATWAAALSVIAGGIGSLLYFGMAAILEKLSV